MDWRFFLIAFGQGRRKSIDDASCIQQLEATLLPRRGLQDIHLSYRRVLLQLPYISSRLIYRPLAARDYWRIGRGLRRLRAPAMPGRSDPPRAPIGKFSMSPRKKYYSLVSAGLIGMILICVFAFWRSLDWLAVFSIGWYLVFGKWAVDVRCPGCGKRFGEFARLDLMSGLFVPVACLYCNSSLTGDPGLDSTQDRIVYRSCSAA